MQSYQTDVAIIGAGPSGLFTVFECGFLGYQCVVIDALPQVGGQLTTLYPEKPIYDIPGHPDILAGALVEKLLQQAAPFQPTYLLNESVRTLNETADGTFTLTTTTSTVTAKVVVIAGGGGEFTPRKPNLEHLSTYEATGDVLYAVQQRDAFAGRTVAIAGGGDSALDWAVNLAQIADTIHLIHRRADFRAAEETVRQMQMLQAQGKIVLHTPSQLHALHGNSRLEAVTLANLSNETTTLAVDKLLCCFGLAPTAGPFADWGLTLDGKKIATEPVSQCTSRRGILAVGDMASYPGKMSLILVGFAEAAQAAKTAQSILHPDKKFRLVYSTSHKPGS